jgi:uncharacterized protein YaaW (UPF0174 family)
MEDKIMASSNFRLVNLLEKVKKEDPENTLLLELCERYDKYTPESLVEAIRAAGSYSLPFTRSVDYDVIVKRVAEKLNIDMMDLKEDEATNEILVIQASLNKYYNSLKPEEREQKLKDLFQGLVDDENKELAEAFLLGTTSTLLTAMEMAGPIVVRQVLVRIIAILIATQTAIIIGRIATLAVPFVNIIMTAWLVKDLAGPAYRHIIPTVLTIAMLRLEYIDK